MISPQALLIAICIAVTIYIGEEVAVGLKKVAQLEKKAVSHVAHVLKKAIGK